MSLITRRLSNAGGAEGRLVAWLLLACVTAAAAVLRIHDIAADSLWLDEAHSAFRARQSLWEGTAAALRNGHLPLHNALLHCVVAVFGESEGVLRLPSAIFGIANVVAIYWVGAMVGGRAVGLAAAILLAFSGFHIWYSQEARTYTLLALAATLFMGTTLAALRHDTKGLRWSIAAGAAAVILLYTHAYGILAWACVVATIVATNLVTGGFAPRVKTWLIWQCAAAIAFLPLVGGVFFRYAYIVRQGFWISDPSLQIVVRLFEDLAGGGALGVVLLAGVAIGVVRLAKEMFRRGVPRFGGEAKQPGDDAGDDRGARLLLLVWLVGPFAIILTLALMGPSLLFPRYLMVSVPALLLFASLSYWTCVGRRGIPLVLAAGFAGAAALWVYQGNTRADWRGATAIYSALLAGRLRPHQHGLDAARVHSLPPHVSVLPPTGELFW